MESREVALARELWELQQKSAALAKEAKALDERYAQTERALQDELVNQGKTSTGHIEGIGIFALRRENFPSVTKARMPQFLTYLRGTGNGGMIEETVNAQTLKSFCKQRLDELAEKFAEEPESADEASKRLGITECLAPGELAKRWMQQYGVETFQKISLSHTKKGK
jgi:hypothetical protein